ncbi:MAG: hypothetical protein J1F02_00185, partial [Lachnospiraceae bacterium]|nr:hypothetical protein [Lachnospiraceae bacterium]
ARGLAGTGLPRKTGIASLLKNRCFSVFLPEQRFVFCLTFYLVSANKEMLFSDLSANKKWRFANIGILLCLFWSGFLYIKSRWSFSFIHLDYIVFHAFSLSFLCLIF